LYEAGKYESKLYLVAEPEIRDSGTDFKLSNGRLVGLEFWSWQYGALNYTYCSRSKATYYDIKAFVNGTDITDSLSKYWWWDDPYIHARTESIDFSLPAKVEILHNFTRNHVLSSSISVKNTFIIENWGEGWYYHVPLRFDYEKKVEVIGLDINNTLTTVKPAIVKIYAYSYYDLTHAVLMYKLGDTWYNSTLIYGYLSGGYHEFAFTLDPITNDTFVDFLIYLRDIKGNEMEQNITRAFYVKTVVLWVSQVKTLADFPEPYITYNKVNASIIVGNSARNAPSPSGNAHTLDTTGGMMIAAQLGWRGGVEGLHLFLDTDVSWYNDVEAKVYLWPVEGLTNIITVAGPGVNQITWKYFANPWYAPAYFQRDPITNEQILVTPTTIYRESEWVSPGHDLAIVQSIYVAEEGRYVLLAAGFGGDGTRVASLILQLAKTNMEVIRLQGRAMIIQWIDSNGNSKVDTEDIYNVLEIIP